MAYYRLVTLIGTIVNTFGLAAILGLGVASVFVVRRKRDPARVAFAWLKAALFFAALYTLLRVVAYAILLHFERDEFGWARDWANELLQANSRISSISALFEDTAAALVLVVLVELGNGFMYAQRHQRATYQRVLRYISLLMAFTLCSLSISQTVIYNLVWSGGYESSRFSYFGGIALDYYHLKSATVVLFWLCTLATIPYAAVAVHRWKGEPLVRGIAIKFLIATIFMWIRATFNFAYDATYFLGKPPLKTVVPDYIYCMEPFFTTLPMSVSLVLLVVVGAHKKRGLWTTRQPFHGDDGSPTLLGGDIKYARPVGNDYQTSEPVGNLYQSYGH